jgi:hypothetical protein
VTVPVAVPVDRAERERRAAEAVHSVAMEGLHVTEDFQRDADLYVQGVIDSDALVERTRARYGLV